MDVLNATTLCESSKELCIRVSRYLRDIYMYEPNYEGIEKQRVILDDEREPFIIRSFFNSQSTLYGFVAFGEKGFT